MALKKVVSLDIGSSNLRAIEVSLKKDKTIDSILNITSLPLATQIIKNGSLESYDAFLAAVKELWSRGNIKTKDVIIGINGQSVISRIVPHVAMEKDEATFEQTLPFKMKEAFPAGVNNYHLGHHVVAEYIDPEKNRVFRDVIVVGIEKSNLDPILDALKKATLNVYSVDISPLAVIRATLQSPENFGKRFASIDIGGDVTTIVVHKNGYPEYIRSITGIGGNIINAHIAHDLKMSSEDAEVEKFKALSRGTFTAQKNTSVFGGGDVEGLVPGSPEAQLAQSINMIVAQEVTIIIKQIRDTLTNAITFSNVIDSPINEVILSGGGAGIHTIASRMENELAIPVLYGNPFVNKASKQINKRIAEGTLNPYEYMTAFGLLLGGKF